MAELLFTSTNCDRFTFDPAAKDDGGQIRLPVQKTWRQASNRMLVIMDKIDGGDLPGDFGRDGTLMSGANNRVITNLLVQAGRYRNWFADPEDKIVLRDWSFAAINFINASIQGANPIVMRNYVESFAERCWAYIRKVKPTHVMIYGIDAYRSLFPEIRDSDNVVIGGEIPFIVQKTGWVHNKEMDHGMVKFAWSKTLDGTYYRTEEAVNTSNTLGMMVRHTANLFHGDLINHIRHVKPNPILVNTMGKFDYLMQLLGNSKVAAVDTETNNLNRIANQMLSIQFAVDDHTGYFLPMWHRETPFTTEQLTEIQGRLRNYAGEKFGYYDMDNYWIMHNGRFDLSVVRNDLQLPMVYRECWDTIAGDFIHDENYKFATVNDYKPFRLDQMTATYGHDYYFRFDSFDKGDRAHLKDMGLTPQIIEYGAFDVQAPFAIHNAQQRIADHTPYPVDGHKNWGKAYRQLVLKQMSHDVHSFAHMERRGVWLDTDYNTKLRSKKSPYVKYLDERNVALSKTPNYQEAVRLLKIRNNLPQDSFDDDGEDLLNMGKDEHKNLLFFEVMKLEGEVDAKTGNISTDEDFQERYKTECGCKLCVPGIGKDKECTSPEVRLFSEVSIGGRIKKQFVDAFARQLVDNDDSRITGRLHPDFNFQDIITGRSNCRNPSLQQTPKRGVPAKFVKRQFASPPGTLLVKADYSAHEVRMWGNAAEDKALTDRFWIGRHLRKEYHLTGNKALLKDIKGKGDLHRFNYEFFFGVPAGEVNEEQRDGVKQIIFGAIYEKSIASMAKTLGKTEDEIRALYKLLFGTFHMARSYLDNFKDFAPQHLFSYSRIGRQRHLSGFLTEVDQICTPLSRRSVNAPIQGLSGDILHTALRITAREQLDFVEQFRPELIVGTANIPGEPEAAIHDAQRFESRYDMLISNIQIMQWCMTGGVTNFYNKMYGFTWMVPTEIDVEIGFAESSMKKWDWYMPSLEADTMAALVEQESEGLMLDGWTAAKAHDVMWTSYHQHKPYLDKKYPFFFDWDYEKEKANAGIRSWNGQR